ncbi:MAG: hypothetical protein HY268_14330 [Deltaproteobacteria bacterium]|nr:hypothetical protein [Deltaproteobacteria bacterium]
MKKPGQIDIFQEFVDQSAREELLAFFDLTLPRPGKEPLLGLGRISQPKRGSSSLRYLSLTFVVDTPDEDARTSIQHILTHLEESSLRAALPQAVGLVPTPSMHTGPEHYIRQIDILLGATTVPDKHFITERLVPALQKILPVQINEMSWWEARPEGPEDIESESHTGEARSTSLVTTLKNFLRKFTKTDNT